jgi:hypothetical protein
MRQVFCKTKSIAVLSMILLSSGCALSPTYGTDKTSGAQLLDDVSSAIAFSPPKKPKISYQPRPELVQTATKTLPQPQDFNPKNSDQWPESPEEKRARLRQIATDNQGNPLFQPVVVNDILTGNLESAAVKGKTAAQISADVKASRALNAAGSATKRAHLSEPPTEYRQPITSATYGELGEDEAKKERRLKAEAAKKHAPNLWRDLFAPKS